MCEGEEREGEGVVARAADRYRDAEEAEEGAGEGGAGRGEGEAVERLGDVGEEDGTLGVQLALLRRPDGGTM